MTQLFSIKPLEWTCRNDDVIDQCHDAKTPLGTARVRRNYRGEWHWEFDRYWTSTGWADCASIEDGKAKAEAFYRARLLTALHPESPPHDAS